MAFMAASTKEYYTASLLGILFLRSEPDSDIQAARVDVENEDKLDFDLRRIFLTHIAILPSILNQAFTPMVLPCFNVV